MQSHDFIDTTGRASLDAEEIVDCAFRKSNLSPIFGAALAASEFERALLQALNEVEASSGAAAVVRFERSLGGDPDGGAKIRTQYAKLSPVHTLNNLAIVVKAEAR